MPLTCSRFILSVSNFARQHLNSFKVLAVHYCVSLYVKVFRAIACLYGFRIWDKCRLQIGRLIGKRGKHCCEMIYQLDSLSLNFKSSKSLVFGIGNLLQYFTTMFNLIYLPVCKSAVCLCRTLLWLEPLGLRYYDSTCSVTL